MVVLADKQFSVFGGNPPRSPRLRVRYVMPSAHLTLREHDVVRLCLEFLHNRDLHISQLSVERETGVINGAYSDDVLFLRQLVLDGQWDDVLEFIQPLEAIPAFDMKRFRFLVLRHKYVELLCIKTEASCNGNSVDSAVEEVVKVLNELERVAPSKEDYSNLCLLLTLPRLTDHLHYKDWNPSNARVKCFRDVFPLVEKFLPGDKKSDRGPGCSATAKNDRLVQLIIKGILYESCVSYCQAKATGSKESQSHEMNFARLLDGSVGFSDSDLSLLSWLQSIPHDTFSVPFEQRTLNVDVERLERPSLETSWTEHMLVTPIKPKTFPHSAMPFTRPRSAADIMSRSLLPALEGSPSVNRMNKAALMALSTSDILATDSPMSRSSFASFHLTGHKNNKLMNTSVDRLFDNDGDVFLSSSYTEFQLPSISEQHSTPVGPKNKRDRSGSPADRRAQAASNASTPEHRSSASTTARSSRRDSLSDKPVSACTTLGAGDSFDGDLLKEYQKHKQRFQDNPFIKEDMAKQVDNRLQDESDTHPELSTSGIMNNYSYVTEEMAERVTDTIESYDETTPMNTITVETVTGCERCSPCEVCVDQRCSRYVLDTIFTEDCGLQDHCAGSPCSSGGRCASSLGVFVCDCPVGRYGKTCSAVDPTDLPGTVTDVHVAYPPMVAAGTPTAVLVALRDTVLSSQLTLHYQASALNIYWACDRRQARRRRPRSHCLDSMLFDAFYCATLPDDPSYAVVVVNTVYPFVDIDNANNVIVVKHNVNPLEVIFGYKLQFTITLVLDTDRLDPVQVFQNHYLQMVYYRDPEVYWDSCFPRAVAVQGTTNCSQTSEYSIRPFELKRSSTFSIQAKPVGAQTYHNCYTDVSYTLSKFHVNFNPAKDEFLKRTTNSWFTVAPFSLPLTDRQKDKFRIEIIVKNKLSQSDVYISNFFYCWIDLVRTPLFAQIGGGDLRTAYAYKELVMSSDLSMDPNYPPNRQQGLLFEWSCNETDSFCEPLKTKAREYVIRPPLQVNVTYLFKLTAYAINSPPAYDEQEVAVTDVEYASFFVECLKNCGDSQRRVNPDKSVYLRVNVSSVETPTDYFRWTYKVDSENGSTVLSRQMRQTDTPDYICIIRAGQLMEGKTYKLVATRSSPRAQADILITVGSRGRHAVENCTVSPRSGVKLQTQFTISCKDFEVNDRYYYYVYSEDMALDGLPVYFGILQAATVSNPLYYETVELRAMNSDGCYSTVTMQVELNATEAVIRSEFHKHCNHSVLVGNQAAECLMYTLYMCRTMREKNERCDNKIHGFWDTVVELVRSTRYSRSPYKYLSVLSVFTKLIQINGFQESVTRNDYHITMLCDILIDMARVFKESYFSEKQSLSKDIMLTFNEVHQIANSIYKCYITVLDASLTDFTESKMTDTTNVYFQIFIQLFTSLEDSLVQRLLPVENAFYLKYKNNSLYTLKEMPDYFSRLPLLPPESKSSSISISDKLSDHFKNISTFVLLLVEILDQNVYWWDPDTKITTQIVFPIIKPVDHNGEILSNRTDRTIVEEPLDLKLYVKKREWAVVTGSTALPSTGDLVALDEGVAVYAVVPPLQGRGRLFVHFLGLSDKRSLRVVITSNFWPDFDYVVQNAKYITSNSNNIDLSYDMYDPDTSLYIGVLPGLESQPGVQETFAFKSSIDQCFIRVEGTDWVANSCLVGDDTNESVVHCRCREVDVTAASALPPAIRGVTTQRFTYFSDTAMNHLPLKSVCAFLVVFALLCLWGRLLDRVLRRQSGVVVLEDNYPGEEWSYLVGVYSGARYHAGTTSSVAVRLVGERGRSRAHVLRRPLRTYSDEWFLLFTPESLGRVTQLRVWVDCAGASPSWYCRKVVVYDWTAGERYVFRLSQWFYLEPEGYQLQVELTPRNPHPLEVFVDNLVCGAQLMYLPVSIFWHHPRDYLTRVEAIALTFFKMSFTSLALLLYYKYDNFGVEDYPSYRLRFKDILMGLVFYLITVPLYLIQSILFKKKIDTSRMTMWAMVDGKLTCNRAMYTGHEKSKSEKKEKEENILVVDETPTINDMEANHRRVFKRIQMPVVMTHRLADKVKHSNKILFVAWTILLFAIGVCCLLMLSEGIGMGPVKSQVWLSVSVLSIILGMVLCEPTRVLAYTFLSWTVSREAWDEPVICCDPRMAMRLEAVGDYNHLERLLALRAGAEYLTMTKERFHKLREQQKTREMRISSANALWAALIYFVLLNITLKKWSAINYYETSHLTFVVNHPASKISPGLGDIRNMSVLVSYINNSLVPVFCKPTWYNGEPLISSDSRFVINSMVDDFVSKSLGIILLRQKRTKIRNCVPRMMRHLFPEIMCAPRLSDDDEDRENYTIGWRGFTPMDYEHKVTPWTYERGVHSTPIMYGRSGEYYREGGYVLPLVASEAGAANTLWKMEQAEWFDHLTRVIFANVCVFNINSNKFSVVSLCMEVRRTIGVDVKIKVVTVPFSDVIKMPLIKILLTVTIFLICIVWLTKDIIGIQQLGMEFFHSFWNAFDLLIAALLLCNFVHNMVNNSKAKSNIRSFLETDRVLGFPSYQWSTLGGETYYELWYFLLVVASAVLLLKHSGHCVNLTTPMMTLGGVAGSITRLCLLTFPLMYLQFRVIDSLLFNYQETTARLPLVNGKGLRTYADSYIFNDYKLLPYLYCQLCLVTIIIASVLITYHYKLAKHCAEKLKTLDVSSYLRRRVYRRLRRNREQGRRLRGGADGGSGGAMSRHTLDAICLLVIQESLSSDECTLKNIKNFVNTKIKHVKNENNNSVNDMNSVYRNIDCKLDKIIYSLTKLSIE